MALADALSEPGRRFNPYQVMLKGHKLNHGQYGMHTSPPETRSQYVDVSLGVLCTRPLFMNGQVERVHSQMIEATRAVHS